jgi:CBS domain-containing protein
MTATIKAADVMTTSVFTIQENNSISDAMSTLKKENIDHLLVANKSKLVGIISKTDLYKRLLKLASETTGSTYTEFQLSKTPVSDIMTKNPISVAPNHDLKMATEILLMGVFHALPVVEDGEIVGIITSKDIMEFYHDHHEDAFKNH